LIISINYYTKVCRFAGTVSVYYTEIKLAWLMEGFLNRILAKKQLSAEVYEMTLEAPLIAGARKAGQFLIVQIDTDWGERIPLTIADADREAGTITLVFQTVGATTHHLAAKEPGDYVENILGPLGNPTHIEKFGTVICVGGGYRRGPPLSHCRGHEGSGKHGKGYYRRTDQRAGDL
jgi:ferredoxin--NADP+ reductase